MGLAQERLYYDAMDCKEFEATVIEATFVDPLWRVRLDRTAFYPTSGGQPNDTGTLGDARVLDVVVEGGQVIHLVDKPLAVRTYVTGRIDWERRFDHMQQHCGQHILSRCFEQLFDVDTIGFHLGSDVVTVDLDSSALAWPDVRAAEDLANQVIFDNLPVTARFVEKSEVETLRLRHAPKVQEDIRIVSIQGFDDNACGGTHPARTGSIGQIRILRMDRMHGGVRLTFACGRRALRAARDQQDVLRNLGAALSTGQDELLEVSEKLKRDLRDAEQRESELTRNLASLEADGIAQTVQLRQDGTRVVVAHAKYVGVKDLKRLAQALSGRWDGPSVVGLVKLESGRIHLLVHATEGTQDLSANDIVKRCLAHVGGKGGGTAMAAQGSAPGGEEEAEVVLKQVYAMLFTPPLPGQSFAG